MNKIILRLKQKYCKHEFISMDNERCIGDTLNWALKITKHFEKDYKCNKCGLIEARRYIYFGGIKD